MFIALLNTVMKRVFLNLLTLVLVVSLVSCDQLGGVLNQTTIGTTGQTGNTDSVGSPTNGATDETGILGDDEDDSSLQNFPTTSSLPLPPGLTSSTLSLNDNAGVSTAKGNVSSENSGLSLIVTDNLFGFNGSNLLNNRNGLFYALANFFPQAHATDSSCPTDVSYLACIPVNSDGSFEGAIEGVEPGQELNFYFYDPETGQYSEEAATDSINENLVHVAESFVSVTSDGSGNLYGMASNGNVVKLSYDATDGKIAVQGDYDDDYLLGSLGESANRFVYNASAGTFVFLKSNELHEYNLNESDGSFVATGRSTTGVCNSSIGCSANSMNVYDGQVFYAPSYELGYESVTGDIFELYDNSTNEIEFASRTYLETSIGLTDYEVSQVMAFDVFTGANTGANAAISVVENADGNLRLFGKLNFALAAFETTDMLLDSEVTDVYDLKIIEDQNDDDSNDGRGAFLSNIGLTFFDFDISTGADDKGYILGPDIEVANPVAMAVNSDKTLAFVISSSDSSSTIDDKITVIDLVGETLATSYGTDGVIELTDYFSGKELSDLSPSTVTFFTQDSTNYLLIGLNSTDDAVKESMVVIELE